MVSLEDFVSDEYNKDIKDLAYWDLVELSKDVSLLYFKIIEELNFREDNILIDEEIPTY